MEFELWQQVQIMLVFNMQFLKLMRDYLASWTDFFHNKQTLKLNSVIFFILHAMTLAQ